MSVPLPARAYGGLVAALLLAGCAGAGSTSPAGQLPATAQSAHHQYVLQKDLTTLAGISPMLMPKRVSPLPRAAARAGTAPTYILTCNYAYTTAKCTTAR